MKNYSKVAILLSATAGLVFASITPAQAQHNRWYVKADAGGNLTSDAHFEEFFGEDTSGSDIEFSPGIRFGIAAGYHVTDWFAAGFETGVFANEIDSIDGADRVDAVFSNVPLLANVRFQLPDRYRVSPYVGAGVGVSFAMIDSDHIDFGTTHMDGIDSDAVFAWQAFGGVRFRINEQMGVSVEYRYFAAEDAEWEADFEAGTFNDTMRFGRTETHAFSVAFDFRF